MSVVRRIYPEMYLCSRVRRRVADDVIARAGLDKNDVMYIKLAKGKWRVHYLLRGSDGRPYATPRGRIATALAMVPA